MEKLLPIELLQKVMQKSIEVILIKQQVNKG